MTKENSKKIKLALFANRGLGDGIIYIYLGEILEANNYDITIFNDYIDTLQAILPHIKVKKNPTDLSNIEQNFDLLITDTESIFFKPGNENHYQRLASQMLVLNTLKIKFDLTPHSPNTITPELASLITGLGKLICDTQKHMSLVEQIQLFCKKHGGFKHIPEKINFNFPKNWQKNKHPKRIIIHPTSNDEKKNWSTPKYNKLAEQLLTQGWQPEFIVSPTEYPTWRPKLQSNINIPQFSDIHHLAQHLYESAAMIGNDSGIGHLSSALGTPTLTIYRKRQDNFYWKPGWQPTTVVRPYFTYKWFGKPVWRPFISTHQIIEKLSRITQPEQSTST